MVKTGPAKRLSLYVDESEKFLGRPVYEVLLELSTNLPLRIDVIDSETMIEDLLPDVCQIVGKGLVEVSDCAIVKYTSVK